MGVSLLWLIFGTLVLGEVFYLITGLVLARTKCYHRLGVRLISESLIGARFTSRICRCPCDGSCDNWTCSKYCVRRSDYRGKYEAIK